MTTTTTAPTRRALIAGAACTVAVCALPIGSDAVAPTVVPELDKQRDELLEMFLEMSPEDQESFRRFVQAMKQRDADGMLAAADELDGRCPNGPQIREIVLGWIDRNPGRYVAGGAA